VIGHRRLEPFPVRQERVRTVIADDGSQHLARTRVLFLLLVLDGS
jgi:hypothetical protein